MKWLKNNCVKKTFAILDWFKLQSEVKSSNSSRSYTGLKAKVVQHLHSELSGNNSVGKSECTEEGSKRLKDTFSQTQSNSKKNRYFRRQPSVLPSKFLLGGNINDPLNLNSLGNSDNAETPKTSPVPVPSHRIGEIPVFIPKNPDDPLRLRCSEDIETLQDMIAGVRSYHNKHRKHRHRRKSIRKRNDSECSVETIQTETEIEDFMEDSENEIERECREIGTEASTSLNKTKEVDDKSGEQMLCQITKSEESHTHSSSQLTIAAGASVFSQPSRCYQLNSSNCEINEKKLDSDKSTHLHIPKISDYVLTSSSYQPSPLILKKLDQTSSLGLSRLPFESAPITNYSCPLGNNNESFSTPSTKVLHELPKLTRLFSLPLYLHPQVSSATPQIKSNILRFTYRKRLRHKLDPIVSPVIPQPGMRRSRHYNHVHTQESQNKIESVVELNSTIVDSVESVPIFAKIGPREHKFHLKDEIFQYGNYNRYYGYRNDNSVGGSDVRLRVLKKEWIEGKDVLDIGCNIGHITLSVARDFWPRRIMGIDIDAHLIEVARKNIMYYVDRCPSSDSMFPGSFSTIYGPLRPPPTTGILILNEEEKKSIPFPYNVTFQQENYVLESDELLDCVREEYDVLLCLSLTKWIHLNFGDDGLKRFFRRGFYHLRPGGLYVLEPQPWSSYKRKKKLTERTSENAKMIRFFPDHFQEFLLNEVGYESVEHIGIPNHHLKGFQRPLLIFRKGITVQPFNKKHASMELPFQ